ncbi:MAG: carbon-nitrogen hydrolase family protein [Rhodopila sp.]
MRVAACQLNSQQNKSANIAVALELLDRAADAGADLAVLPEYVDYLGTDDGALMAAEAIPGGEATERFAAKARARGMWVLAGSIHARVGNSRRCANTSLLFDRNGQLAARYEKLHLFDVRIGDHFDYRESDTVAGGRDIVTADIEGVTAGLSICYDIRFPELYRLQALAGARLFLVPAAFTLQTGRDHWELLLRARAVENQCFLVGAGQVGTSIPGKECYGHSMVVDPWGRVLASSPDELGIVVADLDLDHQDRLRCEFPALANRRDDVYALAVHSGKRNDPS